MPTERSDAQLIRACLDAAGLSARRFAFEVLAGRHGSTVTRWLDGDPMPADVRRWLEAWLAEREAPAR